MLPEERTGIVRDGLAVGLATGDGQRDAIGGARGLAVLQKMLRDDRVERLHDRPPEMPLDPAALGPARLDAVDPAVALPRVIVVRVDHDDLGGRVRKEICR